jgi:hypothetical protein
MLEQAEKDWKVNAALRVLISSAADKVAFSLPMTS